MNEVVVKKGRILLVGFGPGAEEHMTFRAREAIAESDVVIGYSTYIRLVQDLLDGKEVVRKGMTEEIDRCIEAWEQAKQGKTVALISSGDIGVYGMAGPTYEVLLQSGWTPESDIKVEVVPGSTALSACASLVGAPLTHDFCSISLSDLLTPWPQIAKRLEAAAKGNFVIALYNPKSGRRTEQIVEAQRIIMQYRSADTPVAVVKSAYRKKQHVQHVSLNQMSTCEIGMLSTVLIGNNSSYHQSGLMITPRGYANKYKNLVGDTCDGEQRGKSLSMGLNGWKFCVRAYLRENENTTLEQAADFFDIPLCDIFSAIEEGSPKDSSGQYEAMPVGMGYFRGLLEKTIESNYLEMVMGDSDTACCRVRLKYTDLHICEDQLQIESEQIQLRIDLKKITQVWFVHSGNNSSFYFMNQLGGVMVSIVSLLHVEQMYG